MRLALHAVPAHLDRTAVNKYLQGLPGVLEVHDLHIWAMSTTETALTVHIVMPAGHPGDTWLTETTEYLEHAFGIGHATLQIEIGDAGKTCALAPEHIV